jgi:WD40 repeat protein
MSKSTLRASEQGQIKIKQARDKKRWTVREDDTTPLKEASKLLVEQHRSGNNWDTNDRRWLRDWDKLFRVDRHQDLEAIKRKVLQCKVVTSKRASHLEQIEMLIDDGEILVKDISYGSWSRFACLTKRHEIKARAFKAYCQILDLDWQDIAEPLIATLADHSTKLIANFHASSHQDWGDAPDVPAFFGREAELATLKQWILDDRCRLICILGIAGIGKTAVSIKLGKGGIGKTDLSLQLARSLQDEFDYVIWRCLINAPPATEIITEWLQFLSGHKITDIPERIDKQILFLLNQLKEHRCLLILDNVESILEAGNSAGQCSAGYEDYGQLLEKIGEVPHQSCLLLTSREKVVRLERLEGKLKPVRFLHLEGLNAADGKRVFEQIGDFSGSEEHWQQVIEFYNGNPLALEFSARHIRDEFSGNLAGFLQEKQLIFNNLRQLLNWHFERLSDDEKEILYWLAIHREPIDRETLKGDILSAIAKENLTETLRSLQNKLPLEKSENRFTLQPVLIEYITEKLIDRAYQEIETGKLELLNSHVLLRAFSKDYIRESQRRHILEPVKQKLLDRFNSQPKLETHLHNLLSQLRKRAPLKPGYIGGNILNLFWVMNADLKGYDFSHLTIRQAYLQDIDLHQVDLSHSNLRKSLLPKSFGGIHALAFSRDGKYFAAGDSNGLIHLLNVEDEQPIATFSKHGWWVTSIAFSPDGEKLVSSGMEGTIKVWDIQSRQHMHDLIGHTDWVWTVAFSPDGQTIASGSNDNTIKLWDANTGRCLNTLEGHQGWVLAVTFTPDGRTLISASYDRTLKLWDLSTGQCFQTLEGHEDAVWTISCRSDGQTVASAGCDRVIRLWDVKTGKCCQVLTGHTKEIKMLAFSPNGKTLASGCFEPTVRFWDVETGECQAISKGHRTGIRTLAFSTDNKTAISGDHDQTIKFWDSQTGKCIRTLQGYTECIWSLAASPNGQNIASGHFDYTVRVWDIEIGELLKTLRGHTAIVWSVAYSPDGQFIASSGDDETIRVWDIETGKCLKSLRYITEQYQGGIWTIAFNSNSRLIASGGQDRTVKIWNLQTGNYQVLEGHSTWVWTVAFSPIASNLPDEESSRELLASGSDDRTVKIWDIATQQCLHTLEGHTNLIRSLDFSPDGKLLVSGSLDQTLKLWSVSTGNCLKTLEGHQSWVFDVKFSYSGKFIASASFDRTLKIWDVNSGDCLKTFQGHTDWATSVKFSLDDRTLISGSFDGTIRIWDIATDRCLKILRVPRPYEGTNITGIQGLTEGQKETLKALGAVEC